MPTSRLAALPVLALASAVLIRPSSAHEHHGSAPADNSIPIDSILWIHMAFQLVVWLGFFPLTMVLGLVRHRMHVPLSLVSLALTTGGYVLGHSHGGRSFPRTAHGTLATLLIFYLSAQTFLGLYLKAHINLGNYERRWVRPLFLSVHGVLGRTFPVVGWVQCVLGVITLRSWCFAGHLGQCLAHHIMGSAFIAYGIMFLVMLKAGAGWLRRRGCSQEMIDSWVILVWGVVNTFLMHQGGPWTHKDLQHTLMGVLWWTGGAVGVWLSRGGKRSVFPGVIIVITGWAMSGHAQALMLSTMVHALFGYALMAAGVARVVEICLVLRDEPTGQASGSMASPDNGQGTLAFQYLPPFLLVASGTLFMSATDEELHWADDQGVDHITWGLIDLSIAFAIFLWSNVLIDLYTRSGGRYGLHDHAGRRSAARNDGPIIGHEADLEEYERLELRESTEGGSRTDRPAKGSVGHPKQQQQHRQAANGSPGKYEQDGAEEGSQHVLFDEDRDPFHDDE